MKIWQCCTFVVKHLRQSLFDKASIRHGYRSAPGIRRMRPRLFELVHQTAALRFREEIHNGCVRPRDWLVRIHQRFDPLVIEPVEYEFTYAEYASNGVETAMGRTTSFIQFGRRHGHVVAKDADADVSRCPDVGDHGSGFNCRWCRGSGSRQRYLCVSGFGTACRRWSERLSNHTKHNTKRSQLSTSSW